MSPAFTALGVRDEEVVARRVAIARIRTARHRHRHAERPVGAGHDRVGIAPVHQLPVQRIAGRLMSGEPDRATRERLAILGGDDAALDPVDVRGRGCR